MHNLSCPILLIDENQDDYFIIRDLLADIATTRFDLEWVDNYEDARRLIAHRHYDVCLFAYGLGGSTGLELVREFAGTGSKTPFILLAREEDHEVDVAATKVGASDYLLKGHINAPLLERSIRYAVERKKTEAELLHAQRFAQATVDALRSHIAVLDKDGVIIAVNATWREFGTSNSFIGANSGIGTNYLEVCDQSPTEEGRATAAAIRAVIAGEAPISALEYPSGSSDALQWFMVSATRFPGEGPLHVVVAHEDITDRKHTVERLRHSEANLATAQQMARLGSWELDLSNLEDHNKNQLLWSDEAFRIFGYEPGQVESSNDNFFRAVHPDDHEQVSSAVAQALRDGKSYSIHHRVVWPSGEERIVHEQAKIVCEERTGRPLKMVGTVQDITERKLAEATLLESEARFRTAISEAPVPIMISREDGKVLQISKGWTRYSGYELEDIPTIRDWADKAYGQASADMQEYIQALYSIEETCQEGERTITAKDGQKRVWDFTVTPLGTFGDNQRVIIKTAFDITESQQAETEREAKRREIVTIWESMTDAFYNLDSQWRITHINSAAARSMQDSAENILGKNLWEIYPSALDSKFYTEFHRAMEERVQVDYEEFFPVHNAWYEVHAYPSALGLSVYFRDITERKRAEKSLTESQQRLALATESANIGIWDWDVIEDKLVWDAQMYALYGIREQDFSGAYDAWQNGLHPESRERAEADINAALDGSNDFHTQFRVVWPTGEVRHLKAHALVLRSEDGSAVRMIGVNWDITERQKTEESLRESEARFSGAFEYAPIGVALVSLDGHWLQVNQALCDVLGYSEAELLSCTFQELTHPDDLEDDLENVHRLIRGEIRSYQMEKRYFHARGDLVYALLNVSLVRDGNGQPLYFISQIQDITERKQTEEALRHSEALFRTLINSSWDAFHLIEPNGRIVYESPAVKRLLGYEPEEMIGRNALEFVHPEDIEKNMAAGATLLASPGAKRTVILRVRHKDGSWRWMESFEVNLLDHPDVGAVAVNYHDITDRKLAEEELRVSEERFRAFMDNTPARVFMKDREGRYIYLNKAVEQLQGAPASELLGQTVFDRLPPEIADRLHRNDMEVFSTGQAQQFEEVTTSSQGHLYHEIVAKFLLPDANGQHILAGVAVDVTEQKQAETERDRFFTISLDMLAIAGNDGYFKRLNPAFEATLGFSNAELMAVPYLDFVHPDDVANTISTMAQLHNGVRIMRFENRYRCRDGSYKWLRWMSAPFEDLWYCVAHDVTAIRETEEALQRANDELELRVEQRTIELQTQVAERERAEREVRAQARRHEVVAELGRRALLDIDLDTLLKGAVALIASTLEVNTCSFWECLPNSDTLRLRANVGEKLGLSEKTIGDGSQVGYSAFFNELVISRDLEHETRFQIPPQLMEMGISSIITIPVRNDDLYGVLEVWSPNQNKFNQNEIYFLQTVGNVLSNALVHKRAEAKILELNTNLQAANEELRLEDIQRQATMETLRQFADALQVSKEDAELAMQEANAANHAKSEFLSRMSHELRTPMNAILGYGQILEMRDHVPDIQEEVAAILKAGRHLLDLINEVLDIARIESGHLSLSLEPVPVSSTTRISLDLVRPLSTVRAIQVVQEDSHHDAASDFAERYVFADQQRVKQVLVNLISNAIKYNYEGGQVFISTTEVPGESIKYGDVECSGKMRFSVRDTGSGIAPEDISKIFVPFERLGAERTSIEGTGIGLSLCKRLVEAMNGEIGVESVRGVGSTFWVEFPLVSTTVGIQPTWEEAMSRGEAVVKEERAKDALAILYIEDNISNFAVVKHAFALHSRTIHLIEAEQGSVGLDLARSHQPDLILLDLHLPDIMGDVVLQRLKADPSTRSIPVIILSADATPRQIQRLLAAGASAYLTKPMDLNQFFSVVEETLDEKEQ